MNNQPDSPSAPSRSFATTLALTLVSLSVLVLLVSSGPQLWSSVQAQQAAVTSTQRLIAEQAARTVRNFTEQRLSKLAVASRLANLAGVPPEEQTRVLERLLGLEPSFLALAVFDRQGQIVAGASRLSGTSGAAVSAAKVGDILDHVEQDGQYISPVMIDPLSSEPEVLIAVPVTDVFGEDAGALTAVLNLKFMWDLVDQLDIGEGGVVYVVDRQGALLAFKDHGRVLRGENVAQIQTVKDFTTGAGAHDSGAIARGYSGILGTTVVGSYVGLETPDWAVITELPWAVAYRSVINSTVLTGAIMLAVIALAVLAGAYLSRRLTVPLVSLMSTARRVAAGERELQVAVSGPREVAALAVAFNSMTTQLSATLEGLEQRVEQRTADLQAALVEVEAQAREQARLLEENEQQRLVIKEVSVPVLPVTDETLVMPLVGAIDAERLAHIQERALQALERTAARYLLLDITGVPVVDSQVAQGLLAVAEMARMLGAGVFLIGVRPEVAQTIVGLGLDLRALRTAADLRTVLHRLAAV